MPTKKTWYQMKAIAKGAVEILIYEEIGIWGITAKDFIDDLKQFEGISNISVRINSPGGSVTDGIAIYNTLKRHESNIDIYIDGLAASMASVIAMAGNTVHMSETALFMIHNPWGVAIGDSDDMRKTADVIDKMKSSLITAYSNKTGTERELISEMMDEETWFSAEEALNHGFIDNITEGLDVAASVDLRKFKNAPTNHPLFNTAKAQANAKLNQSAPADNTEGAEMPEAKKKADKSAGANAGNTVNIDNAREEGHQAGAEENQNRVNEIMDIFSSHEGHTELMNTCVKDSSCSVENARQKLLDAIGSKHVPCAGGDVHIDTVADETDKRIEASTDVLLHRAGFNRMSGNGHSQKQITLEGNPFRGLSLMELARSCLQAHGVNTSGMDKRMVVGQAFQTTSTFPVLLENTMHKMLQAAYMVANDTWSRFCKVGSVSDFRAHNRYRVGSIGNLDTLNEHGEYQNKAIPDGEKGTITATTKGNIIAITREAIINDDLQALVDLAVNLGRAYKRTIEAAVYSLLAENSGLGPTMSDGDTLFHANHNNLGGGAALSMVALDADRVVMAKQTDVGGNEYLDIRPSKLLVPLSLGGQARSINEAQYDPDTANKLQKPNIVNGLFDDIIDTPRMTGTRRYLFADPNDAPVIEVAFLDGVQEPYIETKEGWNVDGAELKVRGDFGVAATDYRGAVTDAGA